MSTFRARNTASVADIAALLTTCYRHDSVLLMVAPDADVVSFLEGHSSFVSQLLKLTPRQPV